MKISTRTKNALLNCGTPLDVDQIILRARDMLNAPNMGAKSMAELAHWVFASRPSLSGGEQVHGIDEELRDLNAQLQDIKDKIAILHARHKDLSTREKNIALLRRLAAQFPSDAPMSDHIAKRMTRDREIVARHISGATKASLARDYSLTPAQINNIIRKTDI